jgi:GWxTD domain-containing protein
MKKLGVFILLSLIYWQSKSADLSIYYYYAPFYNSEVGTYLETYLTVVGNSAVFKKNENGKYQASVEITLLFNQDGKVKEFRKYVLKSPEVNDTISKPNFIDLQRINLKEGLYNFELKVKDVQNVNTKEYVFHDIITISHKTNEIEFSGIEYIEKYSVTKEQNTLSRNGYDMVPYVADYYPSNIKAFIFYFEIYNTIAAFGNESEFLLQYYIESISKQGANNYYTKSKKQKVAEIIPVMGELAIDGLETGNYNFVVEVRNKENKVIASKKSFFQRSNPKEIIKWENIEDINVMQTFVENIKSIDTLKEYINELYPISDGAELTYAQNAFKSKDINYMQKYFYCFWKSRSNVLPEEEWRKYREQVLYVNKLYGSQIKKGYESDRGRVYLQYGAPNNTTESVSSNNINPYEIWHYYILDKQRDGIFLFYNPEIMGRDYTLIYSNAKNEVCKPNITTLVEKLSRGQSAISENSDWSSRLKDDLRKEGIK